MFCIRIFEIALIFIFSLCSSSKIPLLASDLADSEASAVGASSILTMQVRTMIETVLKHHPQPPTRQQMVLAVLRGVADEAKTNIDLATAVSDAKDAEALYGMLDSHCVTWHNAIAIDQHSREHGFDRRRSQA